MFHKAWDLNMIILPLIDSYCFKTVFDMQMTVGIILSCHIITKTDSD